MIWILYIVGFAVLAWLIWMTALILTLGAGFRALLTASKTAHEDNSKRIEALERATRGMR